MPKLIKFDFVAAAIVVMAWAFYLLYDGSTRFDVNARITLPLLLALEATAVGLLYAIGRWFTTKNKGSVIESLLGQQPGNPPEETPTKEEENRGQ